MGEKRLSKDARWALPCVGSCLGSLQHPVLRQPGHRQECLWDALDGACFLPGLSTAPCEQACVCCFYHVVIFQMKPASKTRLTEQLPGQSQLFCALLPFLSFPVKIL